MIESATTRGFAALKTLCSRASTRSVVEIALTAMGNAVNAIDARSATGRHQVLTGQGVVNSIDPAARGGQASTLTLVTLQSTYRNHIRLEGSNGVDRFPALEIISGVFKVLAGLIVVLGFFSGIRSGDGGALITIWVIAAAQGLGLFALAELIGVFRAIEENTRQAAESAWQTHKAIRSTLASAGASPHAAAPPSARPRKREATASPSWLTSTSTTPQSGWGAIDDIERGIGNR